MLNDDFPLRVEAVPAAHTTEWRADDSLSAQRDRGLAADFCAQRHH